MIEMNVANDITELIGSTPMLRLKKLPQSGHAEILAKLEWYNIGGSVKDRMAKYLIEYAEASSSLDRSKIILEATSGNTGIALAMIAAVKGYRISLVMPESVSEERREIIKAYGAELVLSPGEKRTGGAIELKREMLKKYSSKYIDLDQFRDPANILAHYQTTGPEILKQTGGKVDMVVVGIGTAGTGVGTSLYLKQFNPNIMVVGVYPEIGFSIQGLRNPSASNPTQLYRQNSFDEVIELSDGDEKGIRETAIRAARDEGLLVGASSAAILYVSLNKAGILGEDERVVAVLPDSGLKYLSTQLYTMY